MEKVFSQEVIDFTKQCLEEINAELDVTYCDENNVEFPNGEVDMTSIDLYS